MHDHPHHPPQRRSSEPEIASQADQHAHAGHHHAQGHGHTHGHHHHSTAGKALWLALLVTLGFAVVEAIGGWWASSLALLGDAGHMVTDVAAMGLAVFAVWVARKPPSVRHSYGLGRAEVVVALLNGLFMLAVVAAIIVSAIQRLHTPATVQGGTVMLIAALGLLVNLWVAFTLSHGEQTLNSRAALLHVMADLLGSIAALISGVVIYYTGWVAVDPILSIFICLLILFSSINLLREVLHVIMEGVPRHLDLPGIGQALAGVKGVSSVHDLHIWTLSSGVIALSAHVAVRDLAGWEEVLLRLRALLNERYRIGHVTLQPESTTHILRRSSRITATAASAATLAAAEDRRAS